MGSNGFSVNSCYAVLSSFTDKKEVDQLSREKEIANFKLALAKQTNIIAELKKDKLTKETLLEGQKQTQKHLNQHIASLDTTKRSADRKISQRLTRFKILASCICVVYICAYIYFARLVASTHFCGVITKLFNPA